MSLVGTFNTAVQSMLAQGHFMSNISTNIANVNTNAYKEQGTHFQTLLNHVAMPKSSNFFTSQTEDFRQVDKQGVISATGRQYDIAINGRGFIVANSQADGSGQWQYTRDGAFFGQPINLGVDTDDNNQEDQGTIFLTGSNSYVMGWQADAAGNFDEQDDLSTLRPIQFNSTSIFAHRPTTAIDVQANVSDAASGRQSIGLPFVDALGNSRTLTLGFTANLDASFTMDASTTNVGGVVSSPATLSQTTAAFDGTGQLNLPAGGAVTVTVNDSTGPQTITVDLSAMTSYSDNGDVTVLNISQDGLVEGRLRTSYFTNDGVLVGSYSNGEILPLYKLAIANFAANNNLEAANGNIFLQTKEAGARELRGLESTVGSQIVVGALETSNVDLADQFSRMIVTQRAYSSSATVLRTADEMTQQARDLKR